MRVFFGVEPLMHATRVPWLTRTRLRGPIECDSAVEVNLGEALPASAEVEMLKAEQSPVAPACRAGFEQQTTTLGSGAQATRHAIKVAWAPGPWTRVSWAVSLAKQFTEAAEALPSRGFDIANHWLFIAMAAWQLAALDEQDRVGFSARAGRVHNRGQMTSVRPKAKRPVRCTGTR